MASGRAAGVSAEAMIAEAKKAFWTMVLVLAVMWVVQIFNALDRYGLSQHYGIVARDPAALPEIFSAPFLHLNWTHIESNSGPLFIFGFLAAYRGVKKFLGVSLLIMILSGVTAWAISPANTSTVGASGLVFGYLGYVLVRGLFDRHGIDIVIGIVMALCFAYQFTALVPGQSEVSWQGHLGGFVAGLLGGWFFRERRAKKAVEDAAPSLLGDDSTTTLLPKDTDLQS